MRSTKDKLVKSSKLRELSHRDIKIPTDEPCFPIQVNYVLLLSIEDDIKPLVDANVAIIHVFGVFLRQHSFNRDI